ncbi:hypothetical protein BC826DRAFT_484641 [Russula brevipes]|nr:hypothetical protein BC826DRAFT_484641 [Russula brevipes]
MPHSVETLGFCLSTHPDVAVHCHHQSLIHPALVPLGNIPDWRASPRPLGFFAPNRQEMLPTSRSRVLDCSAGLPCDIRSPNHPAHTLRVGVYVAVHSTSCATRLESAMIGFTPSNTHHVATFAAAAPPVCPWGGGGSIIAARPCTLGCDPLTQSIYLPLHHSFSFVLLSRLLAATADAPDASGSIAPDVICPLERLLAVMHPMTLWTLLCGL